MPAIGNACGLLFFELNGRFHLKIGVGSRQRLSSNVQVLSRLLFFQSRFVEGEDFSTIMRVAFAVDIAHVRLYGRF